MTIRDIAIAFGYEVDKNSEKKVNESVNALKTKAGKILGAIGIGFSLTQINALVEQYGAINQRLKSTTSELANQKELQDQIMRSASNTLTSYETTANAVSSYISQSKKVLKTSESALQFTELATKAWKAAGKEEAQIASLHDTLAKAFQKNIIDAGTFETLLSQTPETIRYLEESLGKSRTQLRAMAQAGVLTASHLTTAFTNSADKINAAYAEAPMKISDALRVAKERVALILTQTDEGMEVTKTISKMILKGTDFLIKGLTKVTDLVKTVTDKLGGTENVLKLIGIVAGAFFTVRSFSSIKTMIGLIGNLGKAFSLTNLKVYALVAVFALIFLLIEDFVGFLNGKESVFGDFLKKMGLNPDEVRESITSVIDVIKNGVKKIGDTFKGITNFGSELKSFFQENESLVGIMAIAVGALTAAIVANNIAKKIELKGYAAGIAFKAIDKAQTIGMTAAEIAHTAATKIATVATTAFGAAMQFLTSPITLVILAIGALIAIIYLLWKNWDDISAWFKKSFEKLGVWWGDFKKKTEEKIEGLKESFRNKLKQIVDFFRNMGIDIKTFFEELPSKALQWGKDMMQNFIEGIKQKIPWLKDAIDFVTNLIDGNLGHSVPKEGPLKDDDKWMPDFMQNLTSGLKKGLPNLRSAIKDIASVLSIAVNPNPSPVTQNIAQGSSATRIINQYNNWTNHFNGGTKQEQADLARSSNSQVNQASTKLGAELAYTR